ncbi:MAG: uroporphyrinogen-III C-methyltransferase [Dehalococcoidia bacterium]|nr:uroporphyrinogen-III C-methyltransferase [Dehalococcoidia bacterium]
MNKKGKVYFVGAGPGDPGLITVKGRECLLKGEVIIYDRLLDPRMLEEFPPGVEAIYAGKRSGAHTMKQEEINALLVEKASRGKVVVRLKGGDPFVFGRGGEEAETVGAAGIPFEIVPGVTAAVAVPSYAGIPVTHRNLSSSVAIVTGHEDPEKNESAINWAKLATATDTLVFLMGMENLSQIANTLIKNGLPPGTPAAVVANGASPHQRTVTGTVENIASRAREKGINPPAILVVGKVVQMRDKLSWFETRPLFSRTVLVTRARHQASALSRLLSEKGALPLELPIIGIEPLKNNKKLDSALDNLKEYSWIMFTSVNSVTVFFRRLLEKKKDGRALGGTRIAAVGPATAEELLKFGIRPDFIPRKYTTSDIVREMVSEKFQGGKVLLPRAENVPHELNDELKKRGAEVEEIPLYRTTLKKDNRPHLLDILKANKPDVITFASSSTVRGLLSLLGKEKDLMAGSIIACIGPVTASTARKAGLKVDIIAREFTIPGLVEAIEEYYKSGKG